MALFKGRIEILGMILRLGFEAYGPGVDLRGAAELAAAGLQRPQRTLELLQAA